MTRMRRGWIGNPNAARVVMPKRDACGMWYWVVLGATSLYESSALDHVPPAPIRLHAWRLYPDPNPNPNPNHNFMPGDSTRTLTLTLTLTLTSCLATLPGGVTRSYLQPTKMQFVCTHIRCVLVHSGSACGSTPPP